MQTLKTKFFSAFLEKDGRNIEILEKFRSISVPRRAHRTIKHCGAVFGVVSTQTTHGEFNWSKNRHRNLEQGQRYHVLRWDRIITMPMCACETLFVSVSCNK